MKISDLELLQPVGRPTVAPDGSRAVVEVFHPSFEADDNVGQLWDVPLDGADAGRDAAAGRPRRLTRGAGDSSPQFSPDGALIAFLRSAGGPPQLVVIDARGGESLTLTDQKLGVGDFVWTPDSATIVYSARVPEPGRYGSVEGLTAPAEPARTITTLKYKANGLGYRNDRRVQLFAVEVPPIDAEPVYERAPMPSDAEGDTPKPVKVPVSQQLTEGDADHTAPRVTPDGTHVLFVAALHDTRDVDLRDDIWMIPLTGPSGATPVRRTGDAPLAIGDLAVGADGRIWFTAEDLGPHGTDFVAKNAALYLIHGEAVTRVTDPADHDLADASVTVETTTTVLVAATARGRKPLLRIDDGGAVTVLTPGDVEVTGHGVGGGVAVLSVATPSSFGELALLEPEADGGLELLTDFGADLQARGLVTPVELTVTGRDGYAVHGWVAMPAGAGPHPVLLNIHGGPFAQYSVHLFDETQIYVDAGYAVVYCNPRGSAGYGEAHGRAIKDAMGTVDLHDVLDFLDGAIAANPQLDGARVGILGGSYGGYLTAWTIAHDHRWAGAIVERGFLDPDAFIGTSDIGSFFSAEYTGDTAEHRATQSPQAVVAQVTTPTLVLHSELDLRCPLPQAESYYSSLKRNGVHAELVIFPGENHELSRSGRPRHRWQRFEIILDWWSRMLPVQP